MVLPSSSERSGMLSNGRSVGVTLRRQALGSANARGLLLTVLGELVLPAGGAVWTSTLIELMRRLGTEPGTTRQALARTAASGWITSERVGRRTRWHLTSNGVQLLADGTKRIYEFAGPSAGWDHRWLVALFSVPETERAGRHFLRSRLTWAGLGSPAPGVWIGTSVSKVTEVHFLLKEAGVADAHVFEATHLGPTPIEVLAAQAWDLSSIEEQYETFIAAFRPTRAVDHLVRLVELVHSWRRFPWTDPSLPRELLPTPWKGAEAAELFRRRHQSWAHKARDRWERLSESSE